MSGARTPSPSPHSNNIMNIHYRGRLNLNKEVKKAFKVLNQIYADLGEEVFSIDSFKAQLSLYYGLRLDRGVNPAFNLFAGLGIIKVRKRGKKFPYGRVVLNLERFFEFAPDAVDARAVWERKGLALKLRAEDEARVLLERMQRAEKEAQKK